MAVKSDAGIFQKMELEAFRKGITPRTDESREWFRKKAQSIRRVNRTSLMRDNDLALRNRFVPGAMLMYFYDPKTKEKLPYYDSFPLTIIVGPAEGGFYGLNLHYLPPLLRAKFLDALLEVTNNNKYDESTKFKLSYDLLKSSSKMKYFKPCFKHYLHQHVRSRYAIVEAPEWEIAAFLPTADWQKQSGHYVYKDTRKIL